MRAALLLVVVLCLGGCGPGSFGVPGGNQPGFTLTGTGQCTSQQWWSGAVEGSAAMEPGMACRACHLSEREGPRDAYMGTAYPALAEADRCSSAGVPADAVVEILDANGTVRVTMTVNSVGNFFSREKDPTVSPYKARVRANGKTMEMGSAQTDGDCNVCHTATGTNGAPGRVLIPQ